MSTLASQLDDVAISLSQRKHQAGRHDQGKHTPRAFLGRAAAASMAVGTPVTMQWLSESSQKGWFGQYYMPEQKRLKRALIEGNITQEDLDGFMGFSDRPPPGKGYRYDHEGTLRNKRDLPITGIYSEGSRTIHISKHRLYGDSGDLGKTVVHEVGHHKVSSIRFKGGREGLAAGVVRWANLKDYNSDQLSNAGLRPYSLTSGGEMLADTFVVMRVGTSSQQSLLLNIWGEAGKKNLEEIFKQMLGMMYANEIRAIASDDGTIDFVEAPVLVERAVHEKTPWYYTNAR